MLEGYIIEFDVENHQSFYKAKAIFKYGTRGGLIREIPLCIKFMLVEEGMLLFTPIEMAV